MEIYSTPEKTPTRSILKEINTNEIANKTPPIIKSPLSPDSDTTSDIGIDSLASADISYVNKDASLYGDLINAVGGLQLNKQSGKNLKPNSHIDTNASSDDDLFQECENELDSTTINMQTAPDEIGQITSNLSNESFHFPSNVANSTAAPGLNVSPNVSQQMNKSIALTPIIAAVSNVKLISEQKSILNDTLDSTNEDQTSSYKIDQSEPEEVQQNVTINVTENDVNKMTEFEAAGGLQSANVTIDGNKLNVTVESNKLNVTDESSSVQPESVANATFDPETIVDDVSQEVLSAPAEENVHLDTSKVIIESVTSSEQHENSFVKDLAEEVAPAALNATTDLSNSVVADATNTTIDPPNIEEQPVIQIQTIDPNTTVSEPMDVDMNETANFPPPPPEMLSTAPTDPAEESLFNQTIEIKDCADEIGYISQPTLNVTIDKSINTKVELPTVASPLPRPEENVLDQTQVLSDEPKSQFELNQTQVLSEEQTPQFELNQTQVLSVKPKVQIELNKTIEIDSKMENLNKTVEMPKSIGFDVNQTFVTGNQSPNILDQTRNLSAETLLPTRRSINRGPPSKFNLNETIVVEKNLPSVNTTFIAAEPVEAAKPVLSEQTFVETKDEPFKSPPIPFAKPSNPFNDLKTPSSNQFDVGDDEFQSPGLILNPGDFDFLLSKGASKPGQVNPRDSILEKFDPILGRKSVIHAPLPQHTKQESSAPLVSTILEISGSESSLSEGLDSTLSQTEFNQSANKSNIIVNLSTSPKLDQSNNVDGDHSQASSTTETFESASSGEPTKADVNMSVGLIHDMKMDNIKSVEQDIIEQPNLKMNDEQKVKQEIIDNAERKLKEAEAREEALLRRITEKEKALNKMSAVVENYEKTMVEMLSERENVTQNHDKQLVQLKSERDMNFYHLTSLESTFSDLHAKYEKSKQMNLELRENESKLKEMYDFAQQQMKLQEQRYDKLKNHAMTQLEGANAKLESLTKAHSGEIKKLQAQLRKEEIARQSIMEQLTQKTRENEELVKICDELINNGGDAS